MGYKPQKGYKVKVMQKGKFCFQGNIALIASVAQYFRLPMYVGFGSLPDFIQL